MLISMQNLARTFFDKIYTKNRKNVPICASKPNPAYCLKHSLLEMIEKIVTLHVYTYFRTLPLSFSKQHFLENNAEQKSQSVTTF